MIKKALPITLVALFTANIQAATFFITSPKENNAIGLTLGGQIGKSSAKGTFGEEDTLVDATSTKERHVNYFVAIAHPYPLLPNIRISKTKLETSGTTYSTQESSFDNDTAHVNVNTNTTVNSGLALNYVDYTLYYQLANNRSFTVDLGVTARDFEAAVTAEKIIFTTTVTRDFIWDEDGHEDHDFHNVTEITDTITTNTIKTDDIVPMLYVATNIQLPFNGLKIFAQGDFSLKNNQSFFDYQLGLSYALVKNRIGDLDLTLGYRANKADVEHSNGLNLNLDFKGVFAGITTHF